MCLGVKVCYWKSYEVVVLILNRQKTDIREAKTD